MRFAVVVFPGSNCERDCYHAVKEVCGVDCIYVWHKDAELPKVDCVFLPGGFSYGDYLRCGAIAKFSPISASVAEHANRGGLVMGICNGFQILTELGLLPGALLRNTSLKFICEPAVMKVTTTNTPFTKLYEKDEVITIPIAHNEGNYFADDDTLKRLQDEDRIVLQYCDKTGAVTPESCPNGAALNIAGVVNEKRNVFGLMPHPERCSEAVLGMSDGLRVFKSIIESVK